MENLRFRPFIPIGSYATKSAAEAAARQMSQQTGNDWRACLVGERWMILRQI